MTSIIQFWMTKPNVGLTPSLRASDPDIKAARGCKNINPRPQSGFVFDPVWMRYQTMTSTTFKTGRQKI